MPKLSIIVPVYNVEEYLEDCITSILEQNYSDFELILIDDGSTDTSALICDEFKKKDIRIKVIHKENGGLSDARNVGLQSSTGKYVAFVDSDDFIKKDMYEVLIKELERNDVDFIKSNFDTIMSGEENTIISDGKVTLYSPKDAIKDFFKTAYSNVKHMKSTVCDGVYKKELFLEKGKLIVEFPLGKINEDTYVFPKLVFRAKKIAHVNNSFYCYRIRQKSIMHSGVTEREINSIDLWKNVNDIVLQHTDEYVEICTNYHFTRSLRILERIYYSKYRKKYFHHVKKEILKDYKELNCLIQDIKIKRTLNLINCYSVYLIIKRLMKNKLY